MGAGIGEIVGAEAESLLAGAIERNFPVTIELEAGSSWASHKSRFLGVAHDAKGRCRQLWLELPDRLQDQGGAPLRAGQWLKISFTCGKSYYRFTAPAVAVGDFALAGGDRVSGVTVAWPLALKQVQRRQAYRQALATSQRIDVALWDGGQAFREQAMQSTRPLYRGRLVDLSVAGMCVQLYGKADPRLKANDHVGLEFSPIPNAAPWQMDGWVRRVVKLADGAIRLGLEFANLEATADGRKILDKLSRLVADMQRRVLRRRPFS